MNSYIQYFYLIKENFNILESFNNILTILVNCGLLYVFWKTYFSKNLKILSTNFSMNKFFGKNISLIIQNKTLKTYVIDKIIIVFHNGNYIELDFSNEDFSLRTIDIFKRLTLNYNFSESTQDIDIDLMFNVNRFEIYCGDDIIKISRDKKFFGILNNNIKKNKIITFLNFRIGDIIVSQKVKYLIQIFKNDGNIDRNIYVTSDGLADKPIFKYEGEKGFVGYINFSEDIVKNIDTFGKYLKDNFFTNDEKFFIKRIDDY